jgi:hypothetical protein
MTLKPLVANSTDHYSTSQLHSTQMGQSGKHGSHKAYNTYATLSL